MFIGLFLWIGGIDFGFIFGKMFPRRAAASTFNVPYIFNLVTVIIIFTAYQSPGKACRKNNSDKKGRRRRIVSAFRVRSKSICLKPRLSPYSRPKREILNMADVARANFAIACKHGIDARLFRNRNFPPKRATAQFR